MFLIIEIAEFSERRRIEFETIVFFIEMIYGVYIKNYYVKITIFCMFPLKIGEKTGGA